MKKINILIIFAVMIFYSNINAQVDCNTPLDSISTTIKYKPGTYNPPPPSDPPETPASSPPADGYKAIYWVHGMIGSSVSDPYVSGLKSWESASNWVDEKYYVKSQLVSYGDHQNTWENAYSRLADVINDSWNYGVNQKPAVKNQVDLPEKCFGIAHSFGTVTLRKASAVHDLEPINGIVSFTGPHGGSNLYKYVYPAYHGGYNLNGSESEDWKEFKSAIAQFGTDIATPPIKEKVIHSFIGKLAKFIGLFDTEEIIDNEFTDVIELVTPNIVYNLAPQSVRKLDPNGMGELGLNEQINGNADDSHRVAIAANIIENPDAHNSAAKIFYSGLHAVSDEPLWEAGSQNIQAVNYLEKNKNAYYAKYKLYKNLYEKKTSLFPFCWLGIVGTEVMYDPNPPLEDDYIIVCNYDPLNTPIPDGWVKNDWDEISHIRDVYYKGTKAFTKLNDYWEYICGARTYGYQESELGDCECETIGKDKKFVTENVPKESCKEWVNINDDIYLCEWKRYEGSYVQLKPYDGLLTVESQLAWNTAPGIKKVILDGSNHLTVRNDENTEFILKDIFDGNRGKFFYTKKKN